MEKFDCWLPSWEEIYENINEIARKIKKDRYQPDIVIALSRGGFVPARVICDLMVIKDLVSVKVDHWGITAAKDGKAHLRYPINADLSGKKVLIVDDITDTGESMIIAKEFVKELNPKEIRTATIFHIKTSRFIPDYYSKKIDWIWVIWPWNYFEDMCNIVPKILDSRSSCSIKEIKENLRKKFKIDLPEQEIMKIMDELVAKNIALKVDFGWTKI
ncbi:MAG: phosphoribosyltransferase [Candidatus Bathyarchaeota archaeon]|nr:MAG: phosphoribosyltransferase [Candidatus Bathyarchaeota archaeon]